MSPVRDGRIHFISQRFLSSLPGLATDCPAFPTDESVGYFRSSLARLWADIHLHRARLFFREKPYPWKSPQDDLAAAEKLIHDCGYHRHDQELADAKQAILS